MKVKSENLMKKDNKTRRERENEPLRQIVCDFSKPKQFQEVMNNSGAKGRKRK